MFENIFKKLRYSMMKKELAEESPKTTKETSTELAEKLSDNMLMLKNILGESSDIVTREFSFGPDQCIHAALIFVDGLVNSSIINADIIEPLMYKSRFVDLGENPEKRNIKDVQQALISVGEVKEDSKVDKLIEGCLYGDVIFLLDGCADALIISCKGWEKRSVNEPATESVVRGPREGFTENLRTNTSLLRRKIKNPALTFDTRILGEKTRTIVCIAYIKDVANPELIDTINKRLDKINTDAILESGYIEQYIEDAPFSIFSTVGYTEKPDVAAAKMLEGRAAILVDGTPFVLTAPYLFSEGFQSAEDYYSRPYFMSIVRMIRYICFMICILSPALFVAVTTFHQELLPTELLFTMAAAREGTPFPAIVEALIMLLAFEILREAGVRLPRPVGQAISIVGALIMGDAAVSAGLIGAPMVIVVAITAVSSFVVPNQADTAAILRLIYLILGGVMGGFGITIGLLGTLVHLSSLKSFNFSYLAPIVPLQTKDLKDSFIRAPLWMMLSRPNGMAKQDPIRQKEFIPSPDTSDDSSKN